MIPSMIDLAVPGRGGETRPAVLPRTLESAAVALGVGGQLYDAWGTALHDPWFSFHAAFGAAFGAALCAAVFAHFHSAWRRFAAGGIGAFARHLSRRVYVLLYGLMGVKLVVNLTMVLLGPGGQPAHAPLASPETFQVYLAYGLLALVIIGVLARAQALIRAPAEHHGIRRVQYPPPREPR